MFVQPEMYAADHEPTLQPLTIPTNTDMKTLCAAQHTIEPYKTTKRGTPNPRPDVNIKALSDTKIQRQRNIIHGPPSKSVVHEVKKRMVLSAKTKHMPFIQLIGDQPVYTLIVQIRYEHPDEFSIVLPSMGPFHIPCHSFMQWISVFVDLDCLTYLLLLE